MKNIYPEVKFPIRLPKAMEFIQYKKGDYVVEEEYVLCIVEVVKLEKPRFALYKFKKEFNPENIQGYTYINVESSAGVSLLYPDENIKDENMIFLKPPMSK